MEHTRGLRDGLMMARKWALDEARILRRRAYVWPEGGAFLRAQAEALRKYANLLRAVMTPLL